MACFREILEIASKLVSIFVPVVALIYLVKGYRLAKLKWGKELPEFEGKEIERQTKEKTGRIDALDNLLLKHAEKREEITDATLKDAIELGYTDEEIMERADVQYRDVRMKTPIQRTTMKLKLEQKLKALKAAS